MKRSSIRLIKLRKHMFPIFSLMQYESLGRVSSKQAKRSSAKRLIGK